VNFSPLPVIMLMAGIILIYSAVRDVNPKDVVQSALKGQSASKATVKPPPSGFDPGAGAGKGGGGGGGGSW